MIQKNARLVTAEAVRKGHPDKFCDQVADAILDAHLNYDPNARVAVEVMATAGKITVGGEITSRASINYEQVVARVMHQIGYRWHDLCEDDIVSMNLWGFQKSYLEEAWAGFPAFLDKALEENPLKAEYFLPAVVSSLLSQHKARVKVLRSNDKWYGVTYKEDKPGVMDALRELREKGLYPEKLWE